MKKLSLIMSDGDKRTELHLEDTDKAQEAMIMSGVFRFFNLPTDFSDMIESYVKIGQLYEHFFETTSPIEPSQKSAAPLDLQNPVSEYESPAPEKEEILADRVDTEPFASHFTAEIQELIHAKNKEALPDSSSQAEEKKYQVYYICPNTKCRNKGKRYVLPTAKQVSCQCCHKNMEIRPATRNELEPDEFGNYFVAGKFIRLDDWNM